MSTYRVLLANLTGCAIGISDINWSTTVHAESEASALQLALAEAKHVNDSTGLPPHGIRVSDAELKRLAMVLPSNDSEVKP